MHKHLRNWRPAYDKQFIVQFRKEHPSLIKKWMRNIRKKFANISPTKLYQIINAKILPPVLERPERVLIPPYNDVIPLSQVNMKQIGRKIL